MNSEITNLRVNLQEWTNRIRKAEYSQFGYAFKFFLKNIKENQLLHSLMEEAITAYPMSKEELQDLWENYSRDWNESIDVQDEMHQAAISYQLMHHIFEYLKTNVHQAFLTLTMFTAKQQTSECIIVFITPIVNYLHDKLDESNSILHLLLKYKKRVEWFTKSILLDQYGAASKNYEQILEDDLRLFLFDQGIEYPFSTPHSPSGRADVVGGLDSNDPIVVEIKIIDNKKKYGIPRLQSGITQVLRYVNDYHKSYGFLVIFNMDNSEFEFDLDTDKDKTPRIQIGDKTIFIIVVNMHNAVSASKQGKLKTIQIQRKDLIE